MQTQLLYHLLGVCLLLIQLPEEVHGDEMDKLVKVCGREYIRLHIEVCGYGSTKQNRKDRPQRKQCKNKKGKSSSSNRNAEGIQTAVESGFMFQEKLKSLLAEGQFSRMALIPALRNANLNSAKIHEKPSIGKHDENSNPIELNHLILEKHSRKKRQAYMASKCCIQGCTRRELARVC